MEPTSRNEVYISQVFSFEIDELFILVINLFIFLLTFNGSILTQRIQREFKFKLKDISIR